MENRTSALEQRYISEWQSERGKIRLVGRLCTGATLLIIATLFFFLIYIGEVSTLLILLSFFVILTNFSRWVIYRLYLVPRFFLALRGDDADAKAAAWRVIDAHRATMLHPIMVERREPSKPEDIAALELETVAGLDDLDKIEWWERFARAWLIGWLVALAGLIWMLSVFFLRAVSG